MKVIVNCSRVIVGCLFIFSGLVKAIDPLGLAYKMQEFFEVWADAGYFKNLMHWLHNYAVGFSIFMITLEVVLGLALLLGWMKKLTTWLLFLLTLFFTFLTSYVLFSGKIRACGCFGDCIPLTPVQTFSKDIILTALIIILLIGQKHIQPLLKGWLRTAILIAATALVVWLQFYVQRHLPVKDCLPYKEGNNILELRKIPKDATFDKFAYTFYYKKGNEVKDFEYGKQPDSTWVYDESKQPNKKLIEKGNGKTALINDFSLTTQSGTDTTEALLSAAGEYYLLFVKDKYPGDEEWSAIISFLVGKEQNIPCFVVTSHPKEIDALFNKGRERFNLPVLTCDGVAIKTAARSNPTLYKMKGPVIQKKYGWADLRKALPIGGFASMTKVFE